MCQFAYYNEKDKIPQIHCKLNNGLCLYSKFCYKQNKYIHREGVENCYMALEEIRKTIPNGAYYVRFVRKGFAYVEINDKVVKIKDDIGIDNYVYLRLNENGEYETSLQPFTTEKKRQYNRKKK